MEKKAKKSVKTMSGVAENIGVICSMGNEVRNNLGTLTSTLSAYQYANGTSFVVSNDAMRKLIDEAIQKNVELLISLTPTIEA